METMEETEDRVRKLRGLGVPDQKAYEWGNSRKKCWRIACIPILNKTLDNSTGVIEGSKVYIKGMNFYVKLN